MTLDENTDVIHNCIMGLWPGWKSTPERASEIFEWFKFYPKEAVERAIREVYSDSPGEKPMWKTIKTKLRERFPIQDDPTKWRWQDECLLWHELAFYAPLVVWGKAAMEYDDELQVARLIIGKNPTSKEREEAYDTLTRHIDDTRKRMAGRGSTEQEAAEAMPYPRDAVASIRQSAVRAMQEWQLKQAAKAEEEAQKQAKIEAQAQAEADELLASLDLGE